MMGSLGLHPAKHQAWAAALSETIGGGLTAAGFLNPLGPAMIIGSQAVAIQRVHAKNGVWISGGGYEYNATIIAAALAIALEGAGPVSLDGLFRRQRSGVGWALLSLLLGLGGAAVTLSVADRFKPGESDATPAAASTTDAAQA
jgi:putative oxidoreductase